MFSFCRLRKIYGTFTTGACLIVFFTIYILQWRYLSTVNDIAQRNKTVGIGPQIKGNTIVLSNVSSLKQQNNENFIDWNPEHVSARRIEAKANSPRTTLVINDSSALSSSLSKYLDKSQWPFKCASCNNHEFDYLIQNINICKPLSPQQHVDLIIIVFLSYKERNKRDALRNTWLYVSVNNTSNVRYVFFLAAPSKMSHLASIKSENRIHHDMVQENFLEDYYNVTLKVVGALKWVSLYCPNAAFVFKTDGDVFLNVPVLLNIATAEQTFLQKGILGACPRSGNPIRAATNKFFVSYKEYPGDKYPPYCMGVGYLMSANVAKKTYGISKDVPFFKFEDVYMGMLLANLKFTVKETPGFDYNYDYYDDPCVLKGESKITSHPVSIDRMLKIWNYDCN